MHNAPEWSLIVPCYNSELFIEDSITRLQAFVDSKDDSLGPCEIIIVDDGSSDRTAEVVSQTFPDIKVIRLPENKGKGAAVREGMLAASGPFRFFIDADVPFNLDAISAMMGYLREKEFDVCVGRRDIRNVHEHARPPLLRRIASRVFTTLISRVVVTGIRDTQCGFKGFRANAAERLFSLSRINGFAFDVEILYLAYKADMDVKRVPVTLVSVGEAHVSTLLHGPRMLLDVMRIPFYFYSGKYR